MFKKEERTGLIVYLYYNRDAKKLAELGDIVYHSKKHRYLQMYVRQEQEEELQTQLSAEKYIKQIRRCHIKELEQNFVGSLHRQQENDKILKK